MASKGSPILRFLNRSAISGSGCGGANAALAAAPLRYGLKAGALLGLRTLTNLGLDRPETEGELKVKVEVEVVAVAFGFENLSSLVAPGVGGSMCRFLNFRQTESKERGDGATATSDAGDAEESSEW